MGISWLGSADDDKHSISECQYKDIPVWSVTAGRPKDPVTYLLKIRYNKLQWTNINQ